MKQVLLAIIYIFMITSKVICDETTEDKLLKKWKYTGSIPNDSASQRMKIKDNLHSIEFSINNDRKIFRICHKIEHEYPDECTFKTYIYRIIGSDLIVKFGDYFNSGFDAKIEFRNDTLVLETYREGNIPLFPKAIYKDIFVPFLNADN